MENLNSMNALKTLIKEFYIESGDTNRRFYEFYTSDIDTDIKDILHIGDDTYRVLIKKYPSLDLVGLEVAYAKQNPYGLSKQWDWIMGVNFKYDKGTYHIDVDESEYYQKEYVLPFLASVDGSYISELIKKNLKKNVDKII